MSKRKKRRRSRAKQASGLPKGAYRLPTGGYVVMPPKRAKTPAGAGGLRVIPVYRDKPDLHKLAPILLIQVGEIKDPHPRDPPSDRP